MSLARLEPRLDKAYGPAPDIDGDIVIPDGEGWSASVAKSSSIYLKDCAGLSHIV